jgi:hypothetical protein
MYVLHDDDYVDIFLFSWSMWKYAAGKSYEEEINFPSYAMLMCRFNT